MASGWRTSTVLTGILWRTYFRILISQSSILSGLSIPMSMRTILSTSHTFSPILSHESSDSFINWRNMLSKSLGLAKVFIFRNQNQMQIFELWKTVSNIPWYWLKIWNSLTADKNSKIIFLTWRVHPGESNSSFMLEGILKQLLSWNELKTKFVYYVIPILNPDGVYYGRYRWNMTGADLNRIWHIPSRYFHPTIFYTKELLK